MATATAVPTMRREARVPARTVFAGDTLIRAGGQPLEVTAVYTEAVLDHARRPRVEITIWLRDPVSGKKTSWTCEPDERVWAEVSRR